MHFFTPPKIANSIYLLQHLNKKKKQVLMLYSLQNNAQYGMDQLMHNCVGSNNLTYRSEKYLQFFYFFLKDNINLNCIYQYLQKVGWQGFGAVPIIESQGGAKCWGRYTQSNGSGYHITPRCLQKREEKYRIMDPYKLKYTLL